MAQSDQSQPNAGSRRVRLVEDFVARLAPGAPEATGRLDHATVELFEELQRVGVDALLLKGPALEQALYRPGERRSYVDVDVLVPPMQQRAARDVLRGLGYLDAHEPLGIDDVGGVVHAETWLGGPDGSHQGIVVELHLWIAGATADPQRAWDALSDCRRWLDLEGRRVPGLDRPGLAMGLATHAAQHGPAYIKGLAELELALERWPSEVWQAAALLAASTGAAEAFAAGLRLVPEGTRLVATLRLPATDKTDWEIRNIGARPRGTFHLRAFRETSGYRARLALLRRALLPSRSWIVTEHAWAGKGGWRVPAAYALHLARTPLWAVRAWRFQRQVPR